MDPSVIDQARAFVVATLPEIASIESVAELDELEARSIGKRAPFVDWKRSLAHLEIHERPRAGQALNQGLSQLGEAIRVRREELSQIERVHALDADRLDLGEVTARWTPGHLHLVTQVREELESVFLGMGYEIAEGPEVETDWYNFSALNMPKHHSARSIQDSFYLNVGDGESWLLRSQTSPVQIRLLERGALPLYAIIFRSFIRSRGSSLTKA